MSTFLRPTLRAKIKYRKDLAGTLREEKRCLRNYSTNENCCSSSSSSSSSPSLLSKTNIIPCVKPTPAHWKSSKESIKEHFSLRRTFMEDQYKRDMQEAVETEKEIGSGCTCNIPPQPTIIDSLLQSYGKFPIVVAQIVSLYLPPKTTPKCELTDEQAYIIHMIMEGSNIFFTGRAGTGKSFLLKKLEDALSTKHKADAFAFTALTGAAAMQINAKTLHSWAGIGLSKISSSMLRKIYANRSAVARWVNTKILIVDEVSMLSAEIFEALEIVARTLKQNSQPFGGMQLVFAGDFHQLPPVDCRRLCFESKHFVKCFPHSQRLMLTKVFRQTDAKLRDLLEDIREGTLSTSSLRTLRRLSRPLCSHHGVVATQLHATNQNVDKINNRRLTEINEQLHTFHAIDTGDPMYLRQINMPECIQLKIGAQVMVTRTVTQAFEITEDDDPDLARCVSSVRLYNGRRGVVTGFTTISEDPSIFEIKLARFTGSDPPEDVRYEAPIVQFSNGTKYCVPRVQFTLEKKIVDSETGEIRMEELAQRTQIPLKLAWSMTIHKSQGMTVDKLVVNIAGAFEAGQAYVAISRASSLHSLQVRGFQRGKNIRTNYKARRFFKGIEAAAKHRNYDPSITRKIRQCIATMSVQNEALMKEVHRIEEELNCYLYHANTEETLSSDATTTTSTSTTTVPKSKRQHVEETEVIDLSSPVSESRRKRIRRHASPSNCHIPALGSPSSQESPSSSSSHTSSSSSLYSKSPSLSNMNTENVPAVCYTPPSSVHCAIVDANEDTNEIERKGCNCPIPPLPIYKAVTEIEDDGNKG